MIGPSPPARNSAGREAAAVLVVGLACALFFWQALTLRGVFYHYDHALQNYPYRAFFAEGLRGGRMPLWTGDLFCGFPLFAESQGNALYPFFLVLFRALPAWIAYNYYTVLHFLLAGVFTYALARVLRIGRVGAALAGIIYMLASPVSFHAHHTNIVVGACWLPALLLLIELGFRHRSALPLLGFAAATAALTLGAQPQYTLYAALVCGIYLVWRLRLMALTGARRRSLVVLAAGFGVAGAIGGLIAAAQLLPLFELIGHTSRAGATAVLPALSPGVPGHLLTLMLPHYFGSPGLGSYWGNADPGLGVELTLFLGIAPLMLAIFGALTDRTRRTLFFAGLGAFAFLYSMGLSGGLYNAFAMLPVFRTARFPQRFAYVTGLCVAILAGAGLERLLHARDRGKLRRPALVAASVVLALATLSLAVAAAFHNGLIGLSREGLAARVPLMPFELDVLWTHLHHTFPRDVWRLVIASSVGAVLLLASVHTIRPDARRARPALLASGLVGLWFLLAFADLAYVAREFNPVTDPSIYRQAPPLAVKVRSLPPGRVFQFRYFDRRHGDVQVGLYPLTPGWKLRPDLYARSLDRLPPNANMLWNVPTVNGFCPLQTRALKAILGKPDDTSTLIEFDLSPALNLLNARYVLTPRASIPADFPLVARVDGINIFENPHALPRAFIVHRAERAPSEDAAVTRLRSADFDYAGLVLVHDLPAAEPLLSDGQGAADEGETARIVSEWNDTITVDARLERPGYLVLADQYYPGWSVTVDGRPGALLRVNSLLKAVRLDAGHHTVRFAFRPASVRIGRTLTLAGLALLAAVGLCCTWRRLPGFRRAEEIPLLDRPYSRGYARLTAAAFVLFLALGPVVSQSHWRMLSTQLDPRYYAMRCTFASAYYDWADDRPMDVYVGLRDLCRWWPENAAAQDALIGAAHAACSELLNEGRREQAEAVAREVMELAPERTAEQAPAVARLARRARARAP